MSITNVPLEVLQSVKSHTCSCGRYLHRARLLKRIQETYPLYCRCGKLLYGEPVPVQEKPVSPLLALIQKRVSECIEMANAAAAAGGEWEQIGDATDAATIFGRMATEKEYTEKELQRFLDEIMRHHDMIKRRITGGVRMHPERSSRKFF